MKREGVYDMKASAILALAACLAALASATAGTQVTKVIGARKLINDPTAHTLQLYMKRPFDHAFAPEVSQTGQDGESFVFGVGQGPTIPVFPGQPSANPHYLGRHLQDSVAQQATEVRQAFASYEAQTGKRPHNETNALPPAVHITRVPGAPTANVTFIHSPSRGPLPAPIAHAHAPSAANMKAFHSPRVAPLPAPIAHAHAPSAVTCGPAPAPR